MPGASYATSIAISATTSCDRRAEAGSTRDARADLGGHLSHPTREYNWQLKMRVEAARADHPEGSPPGARTRGAGPRRAALAVIRADPCIYGVARGAPTRARNNLGQLRTIPRGWERFRARARDPATVRRAARPRRNNRSCRAAPAARAPAPYRPDEVLLKLVSRRRRRRQNSIPPPPTTSRTSPSGDFDVPAMRGWRRKCSANRPSS